MSVSEEHEYTVRVSEDGWRFDCDAVNCQRNITVYKDGLVFDSFIFGANRAVQAVTDAETAFDLVAVDYGWQRGTLGVQRGHHYCALHREEVAA